MRKENGNSLGNPANPNDLQQIKGIGQSIAQTLHSLGIYRVNDLAQYSVEDLIERLKDHVSPLTLKRIEREDWIGQARLIVQANRTNETQPTATQPVGWQEVADFFISLGYTVEANGEKRLQTKAHHSQADQTRQWDGLAIPDLVQWILAQSGLSTTAQAPAASQAGSLPDSKPEPGAAGIELEVSDLWISPVPVPESSKQPSQLRATCTMLLSGPSAEVETYEQGPYQVEIYLVNQETNQSRLAATSFGNLEPGHLGYSIKQDFDIPAVGSYQIYILARLQTPGAPATHIQGPVLQVEP